MPLGAVSGFSGSTLGFPFGLPASQKPDARALLAQLPLIFEPNQGQADPSVKFLARGAGYSLFLDGTSAMLDANDTAPSSGPGEANDMSA